MVIDNNNSNNEQKKIEIGQNDQLNQTKIYSRINADSISKYLERIFLLLILIFIILFMIKCVSGSLIKAFSFDGAMNVQVAQNLSKNLNYAVSYDGITKFDPRIQTGITVLLPVALMFKIFGESFVSGSFVNAVYLILLLLAIVYYQKQCLKISNVIIFLSILILYGTPDLFTLGFGLYGEIPALFFFLLSLIFLHKYHAFSKPRMIIFSGICFGLGYLTKTVILIALPAFISIMIFDDLLINQTGVKCPLRKLAKFFLGVGIPVALFEIYKLFSLGLRPYYHWWIAQIKSILMQAGVREGIRDTEGIFSKFITHLDLFASYVHVNQIVIVFLLIMLTISFFVILLYPLQKLWKEKALIKNVERLFSQDVLILLAVTLSYFGWWLLITPTEKAWYRRIIDGTILLEICLMILLYFSSIFINNLFLKSKNRNWHISYIVLSNVILLILFVGSMLSFIGTQNYRISFEDTIIKTSSIKAGEFIKNLPEDSVIFGFGWWQAPNISFASGKNFYDLNKYAMDAVNLLQNKYLVIDSYAYFLDPKAMITILNKFENQLVFSNANIYIYKLIKSNSITFLEFTKEEKERVLLKKIDFTDVDNEQELFVKNVYLNENNSSGRWAQQFSAYLLKYDNEKLLRILVKFQPLNTYKFIGNQIEMSVYINKNRIKKYIVVKEGIQEINIPLKKYFRQND